ncbi:MAG: FtsQ-type POTRA domain-containing protein [Chitinivibrionales bacterium]|nr:FtsQ-type POTRA domain-containing protein [Chitinivibrionales bacterium]
MSKRIGANRRTLRTQRQRRLSSNAGSVGRFFARTAALWAVSAIVLTAAIGSAATAWHWVGTSKRFMVSRAVITHGSHISSKQIMQEAHLLPGTRMVDVDVGRIKNRIEKLAWVKSAFVGRRWPDCLVVRVVERTPFALVGLGAVYQVDEEGMLLPLTRGAYLNLPLLTGLPAPRQGAALRLAPEIIAPVRQFLGQISAADSALSRRIAQIDCGASSMRVVLDGIDAVIELPRSLPGQKVAQLGQVLEALRSRPGGGETINLCYDNLAFVN